MASTTLQQTVILAKRPGPGPIVPGKTLAIERAAIPSIDDLQNGQALIKVAYLSLDPAMRGWMNDKRSYIAPVQVGSVMRGAVIGKVVASKSSRLQIGSYVYSLGGMREYAVINDTPAETQLLDISDGIRPVDYLGALGLTGLTAYFGILEVGKVKSGDFVVVSGAAGATGSIVGQIAKLKGATVLGIAGSKEKVQWLKDLGFDHALNYKDSDFEKEFEASTPNFIDVFFDNVGGDVLDLAFKRAKPHARFVICGAVSQYNAEQPQGPKNFGMIIGMRINVQGFIIFDYADKYPGARKQLVEWLADGRLKRKETIIKGGLANVEQGLIDLFAGKNIGKMVVEVSTDVFD